MSSIKTIKPLTFHWPTQNPFLFCAHHEDLYPKGNGDLGPDASLLHKNLGNDFDLSHPWKMYYGKKIPGFPKHPHRGFETVTLVLEGFVDHFDSAGASGRYGKGDLQWMTAGSGLQHAEMFPLIETDKPNPLHLFQIWLNLPKSKKFCNPFFKMFWHEDIPKHKTSEGVNITVYAGTYEDTYALTPAPDSWARDPKNHVNIFIIEIPPNQSCQLKTSSMTSNRSLYLYKGDGVSINGESIFKDQVAYLENQDILVKSHHKSNFLLYLEGEPIEEPIVQYGPFVMNTETEIKQAYEDYHETQFGGWPWEFTDPVHPNKTKRIAKYADGTINEPPQTII